MKKYRTHCDRSEIRTVLAFANHGNVPATSVAVGRLAVLTIPHPKRKKRLPLFDTHKNSNTRTFSVL